MQCTCCRFWDCSTPVLLPHLMLPKAPGIQYRRPQIATDDHISHILILASSYAAILGLLQGLALPCIGQTRALATASSSHECPASSSWHSNVQQLESQRFKPCHHLAPGQRAARAPLPCHSVAAGAGSLPLSQQPEPSTSSSDASTSGSSAGLPSPSRPKFKVNVDRLGAQATWTFMLSYLMFMLIVPIGALLHKASLIPLDVSDALSPYRTPDPGINDFVTVLSCHCSEVLCCA